MKYNNSQIVEIDTVVFSTQHQDNVTQEILQEVIIKPVLSKKWLNRNTKFFINPKGRFVVGGPMGDCGLTGRKIIVETYGGMSREESAFSGKNPSKVDCSAVYTAKYIAKNIVAGGLADRCEIQLSYSIGVAETISIMIDTFRTEKISNHALIILTKNIFHLRSDNLIKMLNLLQPIYLKTAAYRHFVRAEFPWEKIDKANEFAQ